MQILLLGLPEILNTYLLIKLTEQALWGEHEAVTGKLAQPIWNVLTSNCILNWDQQFHTPKRSVAPAIQHFSLVPAH